MSGRWYREWPNVTVCAPQIERHDQQEQHVGPPILRRPEHDPEDPQEEARGIAAEDDRRQHQDAPPGHGPEVSLRRAGDQLALQPPEVEELDEVPLQGLHGVPTDVVHAVPHGQLIPAPWVARTASGYALPSTANQFVRPSSPMTAHAR